MSAVAHPNILSLIGIALSEDVSDLVLITALIEGGSLADLLFKKHKKFKLFQKIDIVNQIAYGMHYLHSMRPRIIHRDLKPGYFFEFSLFFISFFHFFELLHCTRPMMIHRNLKPVEFSSLKIFPFFNFSIFCFSIFQFFNF